MRASRAGFLLAALAVALPAFLLTNPRFTPVEIRVEGQGQRALRQAFELGGPDSLYLDYELVVRSTGARPTLVVRLNGAPVASVPVQVLSKQQFGRIQLPLPATRAGQNELEVVLDGDSSADLELRARIHNYFGIAPDIPRAAVVSDEAARYWWTNEPIPARLGRFVLDFGVAAAGLWILRAIGGTVVPASAIWWPAALILPVLFWALASDRHVWLFPETVVLLAVAPWAAGHILRALARRRVLVLKLAIVTLATLLLLETALRAANAVSPSFIFYSDSFGRYRGKPGSPHHGTVLNSRGFNDVERSLTRPPQVKTRIVALGDSFAFGVVPYADNYLTLTERGLADDGSVEVINMGVSATGPHDYRAILVDEGLAYGQDLVLVSVYLGNDLEPRRRRWYERSYVTTLGNFLWHLNRARRMTVVSEGADAPYDDNAPSLDEGSYLRIQMERAALFTASDEELGAAVARATEDLTSICALARGASADCLVVLIPDETQVDGTLQAEVARSWGRPVEGIDFARPSRVLAQGLEGAGVAILDLLPAFRDAARERRLYKLRDTHWNVAGNRLAAEQIVPAVRRHLAGPLPTGDDRARP